MCFCCGRHHCNQDYYPAKKSICHLCKGKGHWAGSIMCPGTENLGMKSNIKHSKDRAKTRYVDEASPSTDESLETDSEPSDSAESSDYNQETNYIKKEPPKSHSKSVFNLKQQTPHHYWMPHDFKVQVAIKGVLIAATTYTGVQVNILPHHVAKQLNLPIQRSCMKICPYGSRPFSVRGKYQATVSFGDSIISSVWYIIKKKSIEPLLSGSTAVQLGIIKFAPSPLTSSDMKYINAINSATATNDSTKQYYMQKYPEAFSGVGKLKDYEVTLHLHPSIKPVAELPRAIPFHLQKRFSNKIK